MFGGGSGGGGVSHKRRHELFQATSPAHQRNRRFSRSSHRSAADAASGIAAAVRCCCRSLFQHKGPPLGPLATAVYVRLGGTRATRSRSAPLELVAAAAARARQTRRTEGWVAHGGSGINKPPTYLTRQHLSTVRHRPDVTLPLVSSRVTSPPLAAPESPKLAATNAGQSAWRASVHDSVPGPPVRLVGLAGVTTHDFVMHSTPGEEGSGQSKHHSARARAGCDQTSAVTRARAKSERSRAGQRCKRVIMITVPRHVDVANSWVS